MNTKGSTASSYFIASGIWMMVSQWAQDWLMSGLIGLILLFLAIYYFIKGE